MMRFFSLPVYVVLAGSILGTTVLAPSVSAQETATEEQQAPAGWVGMVVQQDAKSGAEMQYPVIISVEQGSPAQKAGLSAGDTITAYDNIDPRGNPMAMMRLLVPKRKIVVQYRRNGPRKLTLVVGKRTANTPEATWELTITTENSVGGAPPKSNSALAPVAIMAPLAVRGDVPIAGVNVTRMNAGLATALKVPNAGLLVVDVLADTPAERAGIKSGDIIVAVDGAPAAAPSTIIRTMYAKTAKGDRAMTFEILRKGKSQKLNLRW